MIKYNVTSRTSCHCSSSARPCKRPVCYSVAKSSSCPQTRGASSSPKVNRARCKRLCFTSLAGDWTFRISAGAFSVPGCSPNGRRPLVALDGGIRLGDAGKIVAPVHDPKPGSSRQYRLGPRCHRVRSANLATASLVRPP